jgi:uncharacterized membrane protein (UPF0136 family)
MVIFILLMSVLFWAMISVNTLYGPDIATMVSVLVAGVIVGYLYAGKIQEESRMRAIGRIAVLSTVLLTFFTIGLLSNPYIPEVVDEELQNMFSTSGWTSLEYVAYAQMLIIVLVAFNLIFGFVFGFLGLYVGSKLR